MQELSHESVRSGTASVMDDVSVDARECSEHSNDKEFVSLLISMYKDCPELWDTKIKEYMDKKKRNIALHKITDNLRKIDPDFTVEKLKRKINTLRSNFNREHSKLKKRIKSGIVEDEYQPKLWYYSEMLFIVDPTEIAPTEDAMQWTVETAANRSTTSTRNPRKKQKTSRNDECLPTKRPESDTDIIAKSWAIKLNRLVPDQRRFAEKIINDVLFEGAMETLTREGVIFVSNTSAPTNQSNVSQASSHYSYEMSPTSYLDIPSDESVSSQSLPRSSPCP